MMAYIGKLQYLVILLFVLVKTSAFHKKIVHCTTNCLAVRSSLDGEAKVKVPEHIAFIVDGNGRWATQKGFPRSEGHMIGAKTTVDIVRHSFQAGISVVTLYIFSTENWKRPRPEVDNIMSLLESNLMRFRDYFRDNKIKLCVIGQRERLPISVQSLLRAVESDADATFLKTLCLAISYGGRNDIVQAARTMATAVQQGHLRMEDVDESTFAAATATGLLRIPDPDVILRTSGEHRLSNFLLWQCAYSEFVFVDCLWPDFTTQELDSVLRAYSGKDRRFGAVKSDRTDDTRL